MIDAYIIGLDKSETIAYVKSRLGKLKVIIAIKIKTKI
jgi:hypothetical protein